MKKLFLIAFAMLFSFCAMSQTKKERAIQLYYGGEVLYSRAISMLDSLNFKWKDIPNSEEDEDEDDNDNILIEGNDSIYIGVVAFNGNIDEYKITNNLEGVKSFINARQNNNDKTAFAYAVSKGSEMFGAEYLPKFDKIFMLNFSDGTDNESNAKWGDAGRRVPSLFVYDTARYDISKIELLNSYALGFGASEANFRDKMKKVVLGSGDYYKATTSDDLQGAFNEIAKSIIASSKNVMLRTSRGYFDEEYPKYFRFKFEANGYKDSVDAKMVGTPKEGYEMQIIKEYNKYVTFNNPTYGNVDAETGKVHIPLNNLKFIVNGNELQFDFEVYVSNDNEYYYYDVEDASKSEAISKRIAVVLVLDCSTSMGNAFVPMKQAAIDFIETLENMDSSTDAPEKPNTEVHSGHEYVDLGLSVKWATMNVGATSPEGYGDYYAWGETETKSSYTLNNYKWYDSSKGTYTKYNGTETRSAVEPRSAVEKRSTGSAYYLRGDLAGSSWDPGIEMPNGTITFDAEAGINYEFKVTDDPSAWTNQLGYAALAEVPAGVIETGSYGGNIGFTVPSAGQVTITVENGSIVLTSTVGFGEFVKPEWDGTYFIAGEGVEGSGFACDLKWNEKECPLTDGTVTYTALPAGDYAFKITNGTWEQSWGYWDLWDTYGFDGDVDNNVIFTLSTPSDVTIFFDGLYLYVTITKSEDNGSSVEPEPTKNNYYLVGFINGADYGCALDYENMGEYKFVDGALTATFEADSYVFIKTEGNQDFYFLENYSKQSSAILYKTDFYNYMEKLYVPGNVELTFTLTENLDGTLKLEYIKGSSEVIVLESHDDASKVSWGGNWRMPSKAEVEELVNSCIWQSSTQNGVKGYKVTSKTNGNYIFLPAAGYRNNSNLNLSNSYGGYWTSSSSEEDSSNAYLLYFGNNNDINTSNTYRYYGQSIRPVLP